MSIKILHLTKDEKFINSAYWQFEKIFPNQNEFRVYVSNVENELKFIESNVKCKVYSKFDLASLSKNIETFDLVILHGLDYTQSSIVLGVSSNITFIWFFFGAEVYNNLSALKSKLLGEKTKKLLLKQRAIDYLISKIRKPYYHILKRSLTPNETILKAAKLISVFGMLYKEEQKLLLQHDVLNTNSVFLKYTYYPIEFIFNGIENLTCTGNNILVGNSSSASNNHLEAFGLIKSIPLNNRKVIVPLSYGDSSYANKIIRQGEMSFGTQFEPLTTFMKLAEYNLKLSSCSIVIMNHYRQQAVGTVLGMIWMGAKVFLSKRNSLYTYLKRVSITVYSIESDLALKDYKILEPLDLNSIRKNRELLMLELSKNNLLGSLKQDIENLI